MAPRSPTSAFVVVEGTTGVGKSELCDRLATEIDARVLHFPPEFLKFRRAVRLDEEIDPQARLAYYVGAILQLSREVESQLSMGASVICDRYAASPLALLEADGDLSPERIDALSGPLLDAIVQPMLTVLLVAGHDAARRRVEKRGRVDPPLSAAHTRALTSPEHFSRWEDALRRRSRREGQVVEVDTSDLSPDQVLAVVLEALSGGEDATGTEGGEP